jgi:N-acetylglucosamine transport system substrate-binding protein
MGSEINRRDAIKRAMAIGVVAIPSASVLTACATSSGGDSDKKKPAPAGTKSAANPLGVKNGAPLEAFVFKGGFGDDYIKAAEAQYNKTSTPRPWPRRTSSSTSPRCWTPRPSTIRRRRSATS